MKGLTILEYDDALAANFHDINAAWIRTMFVLEPHDEHVLSHPRETIIDAGGVILFVAGADGAILGTGALMPTGAGGVELTKMGVDETARGTGGGAFLLAALMRKRMITASFGENAHRAAPRHRRRDQVIVSVAIAWL